MIKRNGVTRPKPETKTGNVWAIVDRLSDEQVVSLEEVMQSRWSEGLNHHTIATQYSRWKKFHG